MIYSNCNERESNSLFKKHIQFKYLFIISTMFIATWLTSDIAAVKLVSIFGITLTGGFFIFPFTTTLGIVLVEVYGYKNSRTAIWSGLILNLMFILSIDILYFIPSSSYWTLNDQFKNILLPENKIIIASLFSFFIYDFINSYLMAKMKIFSNGRSLIKRVALSTSISFFVDVTFFLTWAYYGTIPNYALFTLIFYAYLKKILSQLILLPIVLYLTKLLKKWEGIDIFDRNTKFNPFVIDNVYELSAFIKKDSANIPANDEKLTFSKS